MTNEEDKQKIVKYTVNENRDSLGYKTEIKYPRPSGFGFPSRVEGPSIIVETINNHYILEFFDHYPHYGNIFQGIFGVEDISVGKEKIKELSLEKLLEKIKKRHGYKDSEKYEIIYNLDKVST